MARLTIDHVSKSFGAFRALDDVSLQVADGEFVAILGASGCGKTTLLRQIAGFDRPDRGSIRIGDAEVSGPDRHVPPERRRLGIVFQSYALWPHMSVAENVGYGLDVAGVREPLRSRRIAAALALVRLDGFANRRPARLSGGQRQRVALARCLVTEPSLVLLDEPLANLDVHLRADMEEQFAQFHARTRTTMIYVTHEQGEAMALADRIAVMDHGRVLQFATPATIYDQPADATIARFVGDGMVVPVDVRGVETGGECVVDVFGARCRMRCQPNHATGRAEAVLRAADLSIAPDGVQAIAARLVHAVYKGGQFRIDARLEAAPDLVLRFHRREPLPAGEGDVVYISVRDGWILPAQARSQQPFDR